MELEIWHFVLLFVAAFLGGFIDAIAGGGGLISLPALIICGIPPHMALATNKLQGIFGSLVASLNFARKGLVNFKEIIIGAVCTFTGGCIGANLILIINADFLKFLIPVMLMVILVYTIFSPQIGEIERQAKIKTRTFYIIFGLGLGFYDGFFGPGAGSFWTFSFIGVLGIGMKKAVAHTKVLNFVSSMASLIVFIVAGNILYKIGFLMAVSQIIGGYLGSNMVIKKEVKFIKTMFLAVVGVTIIKIICDFYR